MLDDEDVEAMPPAFRSLRFRMGRCADCGLVYLRERPDPRDLDVYYPDSYKCFQPYESRGAIMRTLARLVARSKRRHIERLMPPGTRTLLDYGCGSGTWLSELRKAGCTLDLAGTDIFEGPLASLREQGIRAFRCDEEDLFDHVAPASVGVVHLFHVIEHVPSPKRLLARLRDALVPGGVIIGQTPNVASLRLPVLGRIVEPVARAAPFRALFPRHARPPRQRRRSRGGLGLELALGGDPVGPIGTAGMGGAPGPSVQGNG